MCVNRRCSVTQEDFSWELLSRSWLLGFNSALDELSISRPINTRLHFSPHLIFLPQCFFVTVSELLTISHTIHELSNGIYDSFEYFLVLSIISFPLYSNYITPPSTYSLLPATSNHVSSSSSLLDPHSRLRRLWPKHRLFPCPSPLLHPHKTHPPRPLSLPLPGRLVHRQLAHYPRRLQFPSLRIARLSRPDDLATAGSQRPGRTGSLYGKWTDCLV